jgi:hypothetical protein
MQSFVFERLKQIRYEATLIKLVPDESGTHYFGDLGIAQEEACV